MVLSLNCSAGSCKVIEDIVIPLFFRKCDRGNFEIVQAASSGGGPGPHRPQSSQTMEDRDLDEGGLETWPSGKPIQKTFAVEKNPMHGVSFHLL